MATIQRVGLFGHLLAHEIALARKDRVGPHVRAALDGVIAVVDAMQRYLSGWTRPLLRIPLLREFLTWNLLLVLRRVA